MDAFLPGLLDFALCILHTTKTTLISKLIVIMGPNVMIIPIAVVMLSSPENFIRINRITMKLFNLCVNDYCVIRMCITILFSDIMIFYKRRYMAFHSIK